MFWPLPRLQVLVVSSKIIWMEYCTKLTQIMDFSCSEIKEHHFLTKLLIVSRYFAISPLLTGFF